MRASFISEEQSMDFRKACEPLVKFLNDNYHPHVVAIVETNRAELHEGLISVKIEEFIKK